MKTTRLLRTCLASLFALVLLVNMLIPLAAAPAAIWDDSQTIGVIPNHGDFPVVAVDGQRAVSLWIEDDSLTSTSHLYARYSTDAGATWSAAQNIENTTAGPIGAMSHPNVIISGQRVLAVWQQYTPSLLSSTINANYSTNGGASWQTQPVLIQDGENGPAVDVHIAMDGQYAVAIWQQFDLVINFSYIYTSYSSNYGVDWSLPKKIENVSYSSNYLVFPRIAINGAQVVAVWDKVTGPGESRVFSNYSSDHGANWNTPLQMNDVNSGGQKVVISGGHTTAVWSDIDNNVVSRYSPDFGASWSPALVIDAGDENAGEPQITLEGDNAVVVWAQSDGSDNQVYRNYSADGGASWQGARMIEDNVDSAHSPIVAMSGLNVVAVWEQDGDIYSNYSPDGGDTWQSDFLIEDSSPYLGFPQVAVSSAGAVAVWQEDKGDQVYSNYAQFGSVRLPAVAGGQVENLNRFGSLLYWLVAGLLLLIGSAFIELLRRRRSDN